MNEIRKPWNRRWTAVVVGVIVAVIGAAGILELSGYNIDIQLVVIIALMALGAGLLVSAFTGNRKRS